MCVIAVSECGKRQPTAAELSAMYAANPHGAGYMSARGGAVEIHKGFMTWADFIRAVEAEHFTTADSVVYHFRISTQAGVNPAMTHPFPLAARLPLHEQLDLRCPIGVAHNGIIAMTSNRAERRFSDTSLFIAHYMTQLIRCPADIENAAIMRMIEELTNSKFAIMDASGRVVTIGKFTDQDGILISNQNHLYRNYTPQRSFYREEFDDIWEGLK